MHLKNISLFAFKNYRELNLEFCTGVNCLLGPNGSGKTNLLDAIHYLSMTKGAFNSTDQLSILHGQRIGNIKGTTQVNGTSYQITCKLQHGLKKNFKVDDQEYRKLSEHIGRFPVVMIAPHDTNIISEGNEVRRKFFDSIISQLDSQYLSDLIAYNHYLKQRNRLLKQLTESQHSDYDLLAPYDHHLLLLSKKIYAIRKDFIEQFTPLLCTHYEYISDKKESVGLMYNSQVKSSDFSSVFHQSLEKDLILQRTCVGIHKDEYVFELNGHSLKKLGSQGQQKSFLIALKLTQFDLIKEKRGFKPILLLDDIFDKLDNFRIAQLISMVSNDNFGQLFITDARPERSREILMNLSTQVTFFDVENGKVSAC